MSNDTMMPKEGEMEECQHQWFLYDIYSVNPNFGNWRCERCGFRRKGVSLTDEQVIAYLTFSR